MLGLLLSALCTYGVVTHFFPTERLRFLRGREEPSQQQDRSVARQDDGEDPLFASEEYDVHLKVETVTSRDTPVTPREIYDRVAPSVVCVEFGDDFIDWCSGVIISEDGYLLCASCDLSETGRIRVYLSDGRCFQGSCLRSYEDLNLILLKIDGVSGLPAAAFAWEDAVEIGDAVFSVGFPFGTEMAAGLDVGILNYKQNVMIGGEPASVMYSNACAFNGIGGLLLDDDGRVIGITTEISSESGGSLAYIPLVIGTSYLETLLQTE